MHGRIFVVAKDIDSISDYYIDENDACEKLGGISDWVSDETDLLSDLKNLFGEDVTFKKGEDENDEEFFEVPYSAVKEFVATHKKYKAKAIRKSLDNYLKSVLDYFDGELINTDDINIAQKIYNIKQSFDDTFDDYIFIEGSIMTIDRAVINYFERLEDGQSLFFTQSFDYHY